MHEQTVIKLLCWAVYLLAGLFIMEVWCNRSKNDKEKSKEKSKEKIEKKIR